MTSGDTMEVLDLQPGACAALCHGRWLLSLLLTPLRTNAAMPSH